SCHGAANRLMGRLKPTEVVDTAKKQESGQPMSAPGLALTPDAAVIPVVGGASPVAVDASRLSAGSSVTAGSDTTMLHLPNGGEVRVCPGTTLSVSSSPSKPDLTLGMGRGTI